MEPGWNLSERMDQRIRAEGAGRDSEPRLRIFARSKWIASGMRYFMGSHCLHIDYRSFTTWLLCHGWSISCGLVYGLDHTNHVAVTSAESADLTFDLGIRCRFGKNVPSG